MCWLRRLFKRSKEYRKPLPPLLRKRVLREKGNRCVYCGEPGTRDNPIQVDHVVPYWYLKANGKREHEFSNLVPACRRCNYLASGKVFKDFKHKRAWIREQLGLKPTVSERLNHIFWKTITAPVVLPVRFIWEIISGGY